jgi:hypothetical protein
VRLFDAVDAADVYDADGDRAKCPPHSLLVQMKSVELDVACHSVSLTVDGKYELSVALPEPVDPDAVAAKFSKSSSSLTVTMPCSC